MNRFAPALAAACFAFSALTAAFTASAQTTPVPSAEPRKGPTPEQREKMRENMKSAYEACKDKPDRRACMTENFCAKAEDKAKCQARAKEMREKHAQRMDERQKAHEACTGKRGEDLGKCLREQPGMKGHHGRHMRHQG
jgi:hypothetical protein